MDNPEVNCFLCGSTSVKRTRERRPVNFHIIRYFYKCKDCKGYSLWPKLETWEIEKLYSSSYIGDVGPESSIQHIYDNSRFAKLELFLKSLPDRSQKQFLDFGCGASADTLMLAKELGFQAFGAEVAADTRYQAKQVSGCEIFSPKDIYSGLYHFDVIFIGDVLEHVMDPLVLLESARRNLRKGGVLVIQGPLDGALTFTNFFLSLKARALFNRPSTFPPYHVSLASKSSIVSMLRTQGLMVVNMEITEPYWPAPRFASRESFASPSKFLLSLTKLIDIGIHRVNRAYGTRFFIRVTEK
jgi:SAM-dependent methyltransferase